MSISNIRRTTAEIDAGVKICAACEIKITTDDIRCPKCKKLYRIRNRGQNRKKKDMLERNQLSI